VQPQQPGQMLFLHSTNPEQGSSPVCVGVLKSQDYQQNKD